MPDFVVANIIYLWRTEINIDATGCDGWMEGVLGVSRCGPQNREGHQTMSRTADGFWFSDIQLMPSHIMKASAVFHP
jgi:hypothetical protein